MASPSEDDKLRRYTDRIDRVMAHIQQSVRKGDVDLDLDALAEIACFSRFHFHRIYRAITGETPAQTVRRLRLHYAAAALLETDRPVAEIAAEAGYGGVEAFTRAFAAAYQAAPARYRFGVVNGGGAIGCVEIRDEPRMRLAAFEHRGPYQEIGLAFERISVWASREKLFNPSMSMIGIYYDDPQAVEPELLRSDACISVPAEYEPQSPARLVELQGGPTAVYRHVGPYAELHHVWARLYHEWLATSGRLPADAPCYEIYLNSPSDTPAAELITEICIPLQPG